MKGIFRLIVFKLQVRYFQYFKNKLKARVVIIITSKLDFIDNRVDY